MPKTTPTPRVPTFPPEGCTEPSPSIVNASESEEVIPLAEKEGYVTHTEAGLVIKEGMPFETWLAGAPTYEMMFRKAPWWWGDYLIYGAKHYGEMHAQAVSGYTEGHVDNVVWICDRFPVERRQPTLFFSHHKAAASLPPQESDRLLLQASREHWTLKDVSAKVALYHEVNGTKPKRGGKKKGANVHFKVNANAVSEPLTIDGHIEVPEKPLIWDAKPLRVVIMPDQTRVILKGDEPVSADESDWLANKFNHAHGPALAAWLEGHNFIKGGDEPCAQNTKGTSETAVASESATAVNANPVGASNGAAPNATESAPTFFSPDGFPLDLNELCIHCCSKRSEHSATDDGCPDDEGARRCTKFTPLPAPAAPPASPEPPKATETPQSVADELLAIMATYHEQEVRPEGIGTPGGLEHMGDVWRLLGKWERVIRTNEVSAESRRGAATAALTPLQRAEEAILRFNEASKAVDWPEVGRNAARRARWLGSESNRGLLTVADEVIDALQNNPPVARK